ncbi:unnamed protein product [Paramecium sonneborni]|uniref:Uncharacterized protein n=1 Tax=Paramecium sonneborni TaxID=65129 RepID=A0A8S1RUD9_9CILI|nr:unnamed protein product [Paramecium sonneborni]
MKQTTQRKNLINQERYINDINRSEQCQVNQKIIQLFTFPVQAQIKEQLQYFLNLKDKRKDQNSLSKQREQLVKKKNGMIKFYQVLNQLLAIMSQNQQNMQSVSNQFTIQALKIKQLFIYQNKQMIFCLDKRA